MFGIVGLGRRAMCATIPCRPRYVGMDTLNKLASSIPNRRYPHHSLPDAMKGDSLLILTVCTKNRAPVLANDYVHQVLRDLWQNDQHWRVGVYVIMPDHIHLIVTLAHSNSVPLERWISWWKRESTLRAKQCDVRWQKNFWDRRIRGEENYAAKVAYIRNNPVRQHLVLKPPEWRFQGEIYRIG